MKLARRDVLMLLVGGTIGGAVATSTGLTYYYTKIKRSPRRVARPAPEVDSQDWLLTREDLDAFAEADRLVDSDQLTILDNADIPGSNDFQSMRVQTLGECVTACEESSECRAFTYARSTHASPEKRQMCWLKADDPENIRTDLITYVSGHR